ncbi:hypothetical protein AB0H37_43710 [Actinomadura sp. NPDC023710]|uniref:hypothetical protein n=1 Tax=Actinomadura sp. NPDC023710 TaxID=3158219 RepID=UPI0033DE0561
MSTYRLGFPSQLKRQLQDSLPRQHGTYSPVVSVTPRDRAERKCPVYDADHYEVQAYYTTTDADSLDLLEQALREMPGVYVTTQVRGRGRNEVTNPDFPNRLGASRRGLHDLRPQVIALIGD